MLCLFTDGWFGKAWSVHIFKPVVSDLTEKMCSDEGHSLLRTVVQLFIVYHFPTTVLFIQLNCCRLDFMLLMTYSGSGYHQHCPCSMWKLAPGSILHIIKVHPYWLTCLQCSVWSNMKCTNSSTVASDCSLRNSWNEYRIAMNKFLLLKKNYVCGCCGANRAATWNSVICVYRISCSKCYKYCWRPSFWSAKVSARLISLLRYPTLPSSRFLLRTKSKRLLQKFALIVVLTNVRRQ